jgi:hypothetical protein
VRHGCIEGGLVIDVRHAAEADAQIARHALHEAKHFRETLTLCDLSLALPVSDMLRFGTDAVDAVPHIAHYRTYLTDERSSYST